MSSLLSSSELFSYRPTPHPPARSIFTRPSCHPPALKPPVASYHLRSSPGSSTWKAWIMMTWPWPPLYPPFPHAQAMWLSEGTPWLQGQLHLGLLSWLSFLITVWPWEGYLDSLRLKWKEITFRGRNKLQLIKHFQNNAEHLQQVWEKGGQVFQVLKPIDRLVASRCSIRLSLIMNLSTTLS